MGYTYFTIIGPSDESLFEFFSLPKNADDAREADLRQLMVFGAIDLAEHAAAASRNLFVPSIDISAHSRGVGARAPVHISAYMPHGEVKYLIAQDQPPTDALRRSCERAHDIMIRYMANPFASLREPITDEDVRLRLTRICQSEFTHIATSNPAPSS